MLLLHAGLGKGARFYCRFRLHLDLGVFGEFVLLRVFMSLVQRLSEVALLFIKVERISG
jgi:hypothetical protein